MNNITTKKLIIFISVLILLFSVLVSAGILTYKNIINMSGNKQELTPSTTSKTESEAKSTDAPSTPTPITTNTPLPQPLYPVQGWVACSSVSVRNSPTTQSDVVIEIKNPDEVSITDKVDGTDGNYMWYKIEYNEHSGFIEEDLLTLEEPTFADSMSMGMYIEDVIDGETKMSQLVYVKDIAPDVLINLTLAHDNNFIGPKLYAQEIAMIQLSTGHMLNEASKILANKGYQIMLWDGYRPYSASVKMFEYIQDPDLVADPKRGSKHNRGAAVDVTLYKDNQPIAMPTDFRHLDKEHSAISSDMSSEEREHYNILVEAMTAAGFTTYKYEWWHFNDPECDNYPVMDYSLDMF